MTGVILFGLTRLVSLVENGYRLLRLDSAFFPDLGVAVDLVFTLILLSDDSERRTVDELVTVFFRFLPTALSELPDLVRPSAVVFLEILLRSPFWAFGVRCFVGFSEDRLLLRPFPSSLYLAIRRFFCGVTPRLEDLADGARLVVRPRVVFSAELVMRFRFDDSIFDLPDFWGGSRFDLRRLACPVKCATSFLITSSMTSFCSPLTFLRVRVVGPAIVLFRSPDEPGALSSGRLK